MSVWDLREWGVGGHVVTGFSPGETVYYNVQAKGATYSDWSDESGKFITISAPVIGALSANEITSISATARGVVYSNGGVKEISNPEFPVVSQGLIAHWRFDEGSGQEAYDSTGFTSVAEIFGGVSWEEGMGGQWATALRFDGSSQAYLKAGSFRIDGAVSFSAWVRKSNLGKYQRIFDFGNGANNNNILLTNRWRNSDVEWSIRRGGNNRALIVTNFWTLNEWQHIVCSVDDAGVMKVYRNGELRGSILGHLPSSITRSGHYIGKSHWTGDDYFEGAIDDLRVYDRALSSYDTGVIYQGDLEVESILGGEDPTVYVYWGNEDGGQVTELNSSSSDHWDSRVELGILPVGEFSTSLSGLQPGETYYYRIGASNAGGGALLSDVQSFSTGSFEFKADSLAHRDLLLWLDATDVNGDGNLSNEPFGGSVDQWRDKSGANRHAGNGNGPELRVNTLNGLPVLKFDGLNNYLRVSDSNVFNVGEDMTLFVVAKGDTLNDWRSIISKRGENNVGWQFRKDATDYATFTVRGTTGGDGQRGGTLINGFPHVWTARKSSLYRSQWADGNLEFRIQDRGAIPATSSDLVIGARDQDGITALEELRLVKS